MKWTKDNYRQELLRTGMGCFVFAAGMTFINVMMMPVGRHAQQYHVPSYVIAFFVALAICAAVGLFIHRTAPSKADAKTIRRTAVWMFLGVFFFVQLMLSFWMGFYPAGDNTMIYCLTAFFGALAVYRFIGAGIRRAPLARLEKIRRAAVPLFLVMLFVIQVTLGYWMEYEPSGDNFMVYRGSQMLASDGCFDREPGFELYLSRFPNQWGFLLLCTAVWKLFGLFGMESIFMPMVVIQALLYIPGILSTLAIARKCKGVRAELMLLVMLATCLPIYLAAGVLYTDTFSMPFIPMALNLALDVVREKDKRKQLLRAIACGIVVTIGALIKMTVAIVLIAAVICWMLTIRPVRAAMYGLICAAMLFAGNSAVHHTLTNRAIAQEMYDQHHTPVIHWVMMSIPTNENEWGVLSGDYGITWGMMENGASREAVMDSIYSRIKDKIYYLRYPDRMLQGVLYKNISGFADGSFGMTEMLDDTPARENWVSSFALEGRAHYVFYKAVVSGIFYVHLFLSILACIRDIRNRDLSMAMGYVAVFGGMFFIMIWEARTRYFFGFVPIILLLSSMCIAGKREESVF